MKSNSVFFSVLFSSVLLFSCEKEETVTQNDLPASAKDFIAAHFNDETISSVIKEKDLLDKKPTYEVILSNGFSLDFDNEGGITDIDGQQTKLPDSVIPDKIEQYVLSNHASNFIVGWEKEGDNQDIELDNQVELRFDKNSDFVSSEN